jgi:2,4-dienoyl-CoA reductase-like NADH-dependent reductase (Old Yellow Enzyme family)
VTRAVRREVGTMPLSYNLSLYKMDTTEYQPPGGVEEIKRIVEALSAAGIDAFHVTTRGFARCLIGDVPLVDVVRGATAATVIGGGGVKTIEEADALLQRGRVDIVSMARVLLANPDILGRAAGSDLQAYRRGMERVPVTEALQ